MIEIKIYHLMQAQVFVKSDMEYFLHHFYNLQYMNTRYLIMD